jgi:hypothetical protein
LPQPPLVYFARTPFFYSTRVNAQPRPPATNDDPTTTNGNVLQSPSISTIELKKSQPDETRTAIGFETESVLDNAWKPIRIQRSQLLYNYAKLSKKNLTGKVL